MFLSLGFLGTYTLNNFLRESYNSRKSEFEDSVENFLNKKVTLGDYSGIRFLGFSLGNSKIIDKENIDSEITAKNVYVGIMPFRSFFKQKWILQITPKQTEFKIDKDFFKRDESFKKAPTINKSKPKYELNFNLNKYSLLDLKDSGLKTKVKGNIIYKTNTRQIIADLKSKFDGKGFLKLKLNTKLNQDFLRLELFSRGLNLQDSEYFLGNKKISFEEGNFKSDFKFNKSSTKVSCKGRFSLSNLKIKSEAFSQNINSDNNSFFCEDNNLVGISENLNYGTLTSNFNLNIPLSKNINNVDLKGSIGYINSLNPDIKLTGNIPYWFDKKGINFGDIDSSFEINRTQLSNLNIFRKNDIRGFITAKGVFKGKISDPDISINFNIDYPHYKGIRIREIWEGEIINDNKEFILNMKNRYSAIPSFLSIKFDPKLKVDNLTFSRVYNSSKGTLEIVKENDNYIWSADNFPIDELELSLSKNQFDKINGIINGGGSISFDQSNIEGRLAWSLGKYRNIKLANSLFDFRLKDNSLYVNSSFYPIDGGIIEVEFNPNKNNLINLNFNNISTSWTILTAIDIFNFDNEKVIPTSKSNILDDLEINKDKFSYNERIDFINNFLENSNSLDDKFNLKKYLNKFSSRYNAQITIEGDKPKNLNLNAKLNGYLDVSRDENKNKKEEFSIDLEGGLLKGNGFLKIKKLPLSVANIFLDRPRDFLGGIDINLLYDLDTKSFSSKISSNNSSIKNNKILLEKGFIEFNNSNFDIDFSLLINDSGIPISIKGLIPIKTSDELDLRLIGNGKFIELIDVFSDDYFTFKEGELNLRMIIKGTIDKPVLNGFIVIKDSEIDFYNNVVKDINSLMIFDFDSLEIKSLKAKGEDSGNIFIRGYLPFYKKNESGESFINLIANEFNIKTENFNFLVDSNINLTGSFENPVLGGNLSLNNGFINFKRTSENNKIDKKIKREESKKDWP